MNNILGAHIGHFRVVDRLGKGGMGEVYVGHDEVLDRKVALKCLRSDLHPTEETKLRFLREARVLSQLKHPNICQIFECFEAHGTVVLVLELIHGKGLHTVAHDLDIYQRLDLARQIAAALVAAHEGGIIHRDLKPDNILVTPDHQVKVLDFGLSRLTQEFEATGQLTPEEAAGSAFEPASAQLTTLGTVMGTLAYMSPEQARGERASSASDLYSFGLLLQELFTNRPAYPAGLSREDLLARARQGDSPPPEGLDPDLMALINRLKAIRPGLRPSSVDAHERLLWLLGKPARRRRQRLKAMALVALGALSLGLAVQTLRARQEAEANRATIEVFEKVLSAATGSQDDRISTGRERPDDAATMREALDEAALEIPSRLKAQPVVQARLKSIVAAGYFLRGLYAQARPLLNEAIAFREQHWEPSHKELFQDLHRLEAMGERSGPADATEAAYAMEVRLREQDPGPDQMLLANSLLRFASYHYAHGNPLKAYPLIQRCLELHQRSPVPPGLHVARVHFSAAVVGLEIGQGEAAARDLEACRRLCEGVPGPDSRRLMARSFEETGRIQARRKAFQEAETAYLKALELMASLGGEDQGIPAVHYNLACTYALWGKPGQALAALREAVPASGYAYWMAGVAEDRDLDSLRNQPAFSRIVAEARVRTQGHDHPARGAASAYGPHTP